MCFIKFAFNSLCCEKPFNSKEIFFLEQEWVTCGRGEAKTEGKSQPALLLVLLASPS